MSRIKSSNIQLGESFIVPIEQSAHNKKIQEALDKEKEIIVRAEEQAQNIINEAQEQGQKIIEDARAQALSEVDSIKNQAHAEGFEAGRQEGLRDITNELSDKIIAVDDFAQSHFDLKRNIIKSASLDIVSLVIEIAQKVCSRSLELDDNILKEITENAIMALKDKEDITIIVNPLMAEKIYAISDELRERIPQLSSIKIIEDNSVSPDGTIVESPLSRVDSRVRSQINEIAEKLMAKLDSTSFGEARPQKQIKKDSPQVEEIIEPTELIESENTAEIIENIEHINSTEFIESVEEIDETNIEESVGLNETSESLEVTETVLQEETSEIADLSDTKPSAEESEQEFEPFKPMEIDDV